MPTILNLDLFDEKDILTILNEVKTGKLLDAISLSKVKKAINNSMVGSSKLLHFIRPDLYAIWDSRIFKKYYPNKKSTYGIDNPNNYLQYLNDLTEFSKQSDIEKLREKVNGLLGYPVSALRAIEYVLFEGIN
ncbi:hypothetical protein [Flavihumibacter fluvii]|uniref:hypothetical protein n=1 Tax=Flavihumibacter fluvii TaxID=2838157 RepID=UPI001BDF34AD|nr:hypothetical protein [Flavihumibacter fluvii]ULQ51948.1 hypothetical protein KJS93_17805 [Flavihumibacter fluvii]